MRSLSFVRIHNCYVS